MSDPTERFFAAGLLAVVKALMAAGATPNSALKLAAFLVIEGEFGREVTRAIGLPAPTARRWRAEIAALQADDLPDDPPVEWLNEMLPLLGVEGFELRVRPPKTDQ